MYIYIHTHIHTYLHPSVFTPAGSLNETGFQGPVRLPPLKSTDARQAHPDASPGCVHVYVCMYVCVY